MRVFYDARWILVENRFDGVSRYSHELAWALSRQPDIEMTWIVHDERQLAKLPEGEHVLVNRPENALKELFLPRHLNKLDAKIVYSPFFVMGTLGKRYKLVLTIHDMIYFTHRIPPQWFPWYIRLGWRLFHLTYTPMRWQLNHADVVATVSETARQELVDARATKREIVAVTNAVNENFAEENSRWKMVDGRWQHNEAGEASASTKHLQPEKSNDAYSKYFPREAVSTKPMPSNPHYKSNNIVYMGAFTPYKNVDCLIDALALLPEVTLHLCGKMPPVRRKEIEAHMKEVGVTDRVVIYNGATDDQYKKALSEARCSISASRLEGFGLPVLEAQQRGVPFIAADTPIFHEIGRNSVLYFDPDSPEKAAECVRQLADKEVSEDYIARGFENITRYTWNTSAAVAANVCKLLD